MTSVDTETVGWKALVPYWADNRWHARIQADDQPELIEECSHLHRDEAEAALCAAQMAETFNQTAEAADAWAVWQLRVRSLKASGHTDEEAAEVANREAENRG